MKFTSFRIFLYLFWLLGVIPFYNHIYAETIVSGIQTGIWQKNRSPYIVKDDVVIPKGLILNIEPGVIVQFNGPFRFIVSGALIAKGTNEEKILFTSSSDIKNQQSGTFTKCDEWYGIDFTNSSNDFLSKINNNCLNRLWNFYAQ